MSQIIGFLKDTGVITVVLRLGLALLLGGILGIERGRKHRPAGLRTYMIVCMASSLVMITSEYMFKLFGTGDPTRLGAQVISGIGFLGAGTIVITSRQVTGLTTAAGLWAAACMGLAVGIGFYTGAITCGLFLLMVMTVMSKLDRRIRSRSKQLNLFVEFKSMDALGAFMGFMRAQDYKLQDIEITKAQNGVPDSIGAIFLVNLGESLNHLHVIQNLSQCEGVKYMEELEAF